MKILTINHEFPPVGGGASPVSFELSRALARKGHHIDVVTVRYKDAARFETIDGVNIYRTPGLRKKTDISHPHELVTFLLGSFFKTLSLARRNKYDVIHCHFVVPGGILAFLVSKLTKTPYIITSHGSDVPGHNPDRFKLIHKIIRPFWKFIVNSAKCVTTPSGFLADKIHKISPKATVKVIPNGIDVDRFDNSTEKKNKILLCSRILKFKGIQYFIEAVKDKAIEWEVDIIGDGPYLDELKDLARDSKTEIVFHGWLDKNSDKYRQLFSQASIFIAPSTAESFGMVTAEAMAAGTAIIASDIPAHREILADAGVLTEPANPHQILQQLQLLIDGRLDREALQQKALQRVRAYSWDSIAEKFETVFKGIADGHGNT